jgi:tetratricopeptide (TPR) repeat protein
MQRPVVSVLTLLVSLVLAGCATAFGDGGGTALRQGRYVDAVESFEQVLAHDPDRVDALIGLGLAKYRLGAFDEAAEALDRAVLRVPTHFTGRLYLGLARLRRADDGAAEENLATVASMMPGTKTAGQIDRALRVLRGRDPVGDELRAFMATAIEDGVSLERQVRETQAALRDAERYRDRAIYVPSATRRSRSPLEILFR